MSSPTRSEVSGLVDHTLLKPESTAEQVSELVAEARRIFGDDLAEVRAVS